MPRISAAGSEAGKKCSQLQFCALRTPISGLRVTVILYSALNHSPLGLGPQRLGRGSRPVAAARRSRKEAEPSGRPIVSAARSAETASAETGVFEKVGEAAAAAINQRRDADEPVVAAFEMRDCARPALVLGPRDEFRPDRVQRHIARRRRQTRHGPSAASAKNPKIPLSLFPKPCYNASFGQKRPPRGRPGEAGMVDERAPALARRLTAHGRVLRRGRIFARLREGWAYDEIAAHERLTAERVRQIVRQTLEKRIIDEGAEHAKLQLERLAPAMRLAGEAIAEGDVAAIAPLMKVLDRLDRYQKVAKAVQVYDDEARAKLMDKINRVAANLGVDEARAAAKAAEATIAAPLGGEAAALAGAQTDAGEA